MRTSRLERGQAIMGFTMDNMPTPIEKTKAIIGPVLLPEDVLGLKKMKISSQNNPTDGSMLNNRVDIEGNPNTPKITTSGEMLINALKPVGKNPF